MALMEELESQRQVCNELNKKVKENKDLSQKMEQMQKEKDELSLQFDSAQKTIQSLSLQVIVLVFLMFHVIGIFVGDRVKPDRFNTATAFEL